MNKSVVILYSEMAGYLLSCLKELSSNNIKIYVYHWPVNKEAPFIFPEIDNVVFKDSSAVDQDRLFSEIKNIHPDLILCSGWMDKKYLKVTKKFFKKIPTVVALDNHWYGSAKQKIMTLLSPFYLQKIFSHAWVAGEPQAVYARKLGFKNDRLLDGFYSADVSFFNRQYEANLSAKTVAFPKTFLFVGRYLPFKGIYELWEAFIQLKNESESDWKLVCVGLGDDFEKRVLHKDIEHLGFIQSDEMIDVIKRAGVFVLASHYEPWGVVAHEFAAAGMPMILSDAIGAKSAFLKDGENGFSFRIKSVDEIKQAMKKIMDLNDKELLNMGNKSHQLASLNNPSKWTQKLIKLL